MKSILMKKYRQFIAMAILLLAMVLMAWYGIVPFHKFIVGKADEIQEFYTIRENRQKQIDKLPELEAQFNLITNDEKKLGIILPETRIVDFVKTLEGLANETKTEIMIQSPDKGAIQDKATVKKPMKKATDAEKSDEAGKAVPTILDNLPFDRYLRINITLRGEYKDIVIFLQKMETLPFALDVVGVQMKLGEKDDKKMNVPDPKNPNPFLLSPGTSLLAPGAEKVETETPNGRVEAIFDTVVFVNKAE